MELLYSGGSFLLSTYSILNINKHIHKLLEDYKGIKEAKIYTPSTFLEDLPRISDLSLGEQSKTNKNEIKFNGFIEGVVNSNTFISSSLKEAVKLVYKMTFQSQIYDNDRFLNKVTLLKQIPKKKEVNQLPFFDLKDFENDASFCRIYKNSNVIANQALSIIDTKTLPNSGISIFRRILSFFKIFIQIISLFAEDRLSYKGVQVGTCDVELGIELKSLIMVYGKIIYNFVTKSLRIEKPEYFLKDKSFILEEIAKAIRRKRVILALYFVVNFYCLVKLLRHSYSFLKRWLKKKEAKQEIELHDLEKFRQNEHMKCVVCFQHVRNVIFKPCKHLAVCRVCLHSIKRSKKCPICKEEFHSVVEIFTK